VVLIGACEQVPGAVLLLLSSRHLVVTRAKSSNGSPSVDGTACIQCVPTSAALAENMPQFTVRFDAATGVMHVAVSTFVGQLHVARFRFADPASGCVEETLPVERYNVRLRQPVGSCAIDSLQWIPDMDYTGSPMLAVTVRHPGGGHAQSGASHFYVAMLRHGNGASVGALEEGPWFIECLRTANVDPRITNSLTSASISPMPVSLQLPDDGGVTNSKNAIFVALVHRTEITFRNDKTVVGEFSLSGLRAPPIAAAASSVGSQAKVVVVAADGTILCVRVRLVSAATGRMRSASKAVQYATMDGAEIEFGDDNHRLTAMHQAVASSCTACAVHASFTQVTHGCFIVAVSCGGQSFLIGVAEVEASADGEMQYLGNVVTEHQTSAGTNVNVVASTTGPWPIVDIAATVSSSVAIRERVARVTSTSSSSVALTASSQIDNTHIPLQVVVASNTDIVVSVSGEFLFFDANAMSKPKVVGCVSSAHIPRPCNLLAVSAFGGDHAIIVTDRGVFATASQDRTALQFSDADSPSIVVTAGCACDFALHHSDSSLRGVAIAASVSGEAMLVWARTTTVGTAVMPLAGAPIVSAVAGGMLSGSGTIAAVLPTSTVAVLKTAAANNVVTLTLSDDIALCDGRPVAELCFFAGKLLGVSVDGAVVGVFDGSAHIRYVRLGTGLMPCATTRRIAPLHTSPFILVNGNVLDIEVGRVIAAARGEAGSVVQPISRQGLDVVAAGFGVTVFAQHGEDTTFELTVHHNVDVAVQRAVMCRSIPSATNQLHTNRKARAVASLSSSAVLSVSPGTGLMLSVGGDGGVLLSSVSSSTLLTIVTTSLSAMLRGDTCATGGVAAVGASSQPANATVASLTPIAVSLLDELLSADGVTKEAHFVMTLRDAAGAAFLAIVAAVAVADGIGVMAAHGNVAASRLPPLVGNLSITSFAALGGSCFPVFALKPSSAPNGHRELFCVIEGALFAAHPTATATDEAEHDPMRLSPVATWALRLSSSRTAFSHIVSLNNKSSEHDIQTTTCMDAALHRDGSVMVAVCDVLGRVAVVRTAAHATPLVTVLTNSTPPMTHIAIVAEGSDGGAVVAATDAFGFLHAWRCVGHDCGGDPLAAWNELPKQPCATASRVTSLSTSRQDHGIVVWVSSADAALQEILL
jgi:hypothetical protein